MHKGWFTSGPHDVQISFRWHAATAAAAAAADCDKTVFDVLLNVAEQDGNATSAGDKEQRIVGRGGRQSRGNGGNRGAGHRRWLAVRPFYQQAIKLTPSRCRLLARGAAGASAGRNGRIKNSKARLIFVLAQSWHYLPSLKPRRPPLAPLLYLHAPHQELAFFFRRGVTPKKIRRRAFRRVEEPIFRRLTVKANGAESRGNKGGGEVRSGSPRSQSEASCGSVQPRRRLTG